jgi:hypothetical protein
MSNAENLPPKKKKLKKWQWALLIFIVIPLVVTLIFGNSTSTTSEQEPQIPAEPEVDLRYSAEISRWEPLNPASGRAFFTITNTGEASFVPESCTVRVEDDSLTYKGFDFISGFSEIKPGGRFVGNVVLTVTKEGAYFVTTGSVDCELKAVS